jgi:hypothetical protein
MVQCNEEGTDGAWEGSCQRDAILRLKNMRPFFPTEHFVRDCGKAGRTGVRIPFWGDLRLSRNVQTGSEATQSPLLKGYRVSFPEVGQPGRGADHPPSSSAEGETEWNFTYALAVPPPPPRLPGPYETTLPAYVNPVSFPHIALQKFIAYYGTRRFITAFTTTRHQSVLSARPIQSMAPIPLLEDPF